MSGPVFMYRKGEAKIFASPNAVPSGEGWVDSPAKAEAAPKKKAPAKVKTKPKAAK
jgi:hypothetical protein